MTTTAWCDRAHSPSPSQLIGDPPLLERWIRGLNELTTTPAAEKDWPSAAEDAKARLGIRMFEFALGAGTGAEQDQEQEQVEPAADPRRVRHALAPLVFETMATLPAIHRAAILGLLLLGVHAGIWADPLGDDGWFPVLAEALSHLDKDDIPPQLSSAAASWASVAVYLMHEHRPTTGRPAELLRYEKTAAAMSYLFPDADRQLVADLVEPFRNESGFPIDADAVMDFIGMVVQEDPLAEAIDILETNHPAWRTDKHGDRLLHVSGDYRNAFLPAAEALDAIPGSGSAAVLATGVGVVWTLAIRDADSLIRIEKDAKGQVTWWDYRTGPLAGPTRIARDPETGNRARVRHGALTQPFPAAVQAMVAIGADPTIDPPSACPYDE